MLNPLHPNLPQLAFLCMPTCNKFDTRFVYRQWQEVQHVYEHELEHAIGPLVGNSSDDDYRRNLGFVFSYRKEEMEDRFYNIRDLCDQGYIHNHKTLLNPPDHATRVLITQPKPESNVAGDMRSPPCCLVLRGNILQQREHIKYAAPGKASDISRVSKDQQPAPVPAIKTSKRKIDVADQEISEAASKKKKEKTTPGKKFRETNLKKLSMLLVRKMGKNGQLPTNTQQSLQVIDVHDGINQTTAQRFNNQPLLSCVLNGTVTFKRNSVIVVRAKKHKMRTITSQTLSLRTTSNYLQSRE
ncbi:hypothetical protein ACROYT_G015637 [Oculina patagonica]